MNKAFSTGLVSITETNTTIAIQQSMSSNKPQAKSIQSPASIVMPVINTVLPQRPDLDNLSVIFSQNVWSVGHFGLTWKQGN